MFKTPTPALARRRGDLRIQGSQKQFVTVISAGGRRRRADLDQPKTKKFHPVD
jgi:hypothetical protein